MMASLLVLAQVLAQATGPAATTEPPPTTTEPPPTTTEPPATTTGPATTTEPAAATEPAATATESAPPSAGTPGRTAALIAVGVGLPVVAVGLGALMTLPVLAECNARRGTLCGLNVVLGMLVGGVVGLVLMPFGLWLTDSVLRDPATTGESRATGARAGLVGALIGLGAGLVVGIGLVALSTTLHRSAPEAEVVVAITGGVIALAAPVACYFVGKSFASSPKPQVGLVPLRDGALVTVGAAF